MSNKMNSREADWLDVKYIIALMKWADTKFTWDYFTPEPATETHYTLPLA